MFKQQIVKLIELVIYAVKELIAYNQRAAQGLLLTSIFLIAFVRYLVDSGNLFELFCAWLCGYIYVRFISHLDPVEIQAEPMYVDFTSHGKTIEGLTKEIKFSEKTVETLFSIGWPIVMIYVGCMILVDLKRGAKDGNDIQ